MKISEKRKINRLLAREPLSALLDHLAAMDPGALVNPLFAGICHADPTVRWHAIMAMGVTVPRLAERDLEAARVVMRRFIWSLNDESGGIGWGAPESMAEIMIHHSTLAKEYGHLLVSYMREDGFYLEYEPLQRGLMWGLGRVAAADNSLLSRWDADIFLPLYLEADDPTVRGLAARALGFLGICDGVLRPLEKAIHSPGSAQVYMPEQDAVISLSVSDLAREALYRLKERP